MTRESPVRVVTRFGNGSLKVRDYRDFAFLLHAYAQNGCDDFSTKPALRGLPLFHGLIGPLPDEGQAARYESPEVFEKLTEAWFRESTVRKGGQPVRSLVKRQ